MKNTIWAASAVAVLISGCAMSVDTDPTSANSDDEAVGAVDEALVDPGLVPGTYCPNGQTRTPLTQVLPFNYASHTVCPEVLKAATNTCKSYLTTCKNSPTACGMLHNCMAGIAAVGSYQGITNPANCVCLTSLSTPGTWGMNNWINCINAHAGTACSVPGLGAIDRCGFFC